MTNQAQSETILSASALWENRASALLDQFMAVPADQNGDLWLIFGQFCTVRRDAYAVLRGARKSAAYHDRVNAINRINRAALYIRTLDNEMRTALHMPLDETDWTRD